MIAQKEHIDELNDFFVSKHKKDKKEIKMKKKKKKYDPLIFVPSVSDYSLIDKNNVSIVKVTRVPKVNLHDATEMKKRSIVQNNKELLEIKYDFLFEFTDEKQYETVLNKIDPLDEKLKQNKSILEKLHKKKEEDIRKIKNRFETLEMEKELLIVQLKEEAEKEVLDQYIKLSKELLEHNIKMRELEEQIIEIDSLK